MRSRLAIATVTAALVAAVTAAPPAQAAARMEILPLPPGAESGYAVDISATGVVYGTYVPANTTPNSSVAVSWRNGRLVPLEADDGGRSEVIAANDLGMAVGNHYGADGIKRATLWAWGKRINLDPPWSTASELFGINNRGQILFGAGRNVGNSSEIVIMLWEAGQSRIVTTSKYYPAFALGEDGTVAATVYQNPELGNQTLVWKGNDPVWEIPNRTNVRAVSPRGDVLVKQSNGLDHEIWRDGKQTGTIPSLPDYPDVSVGLVYPGVPSGPYFNSAGEMIGTASKRGASHALRGSNGVSTDLTPDPGTSSYGYTINERGAVTIAQCLKGASVCTTEIVARDGARTVITPPAGSRSVAPLGLHPYLPWVVGIVDTGNDISPFVWR